MYEGVVPVEGHDFSVCILLDPQGRDRQFVAVCRLDPDGFHKQELRPPPQQLWLYSYPQSKSGSRAMQAQFCANHLAISLGQRTRPPLL